MGKVSTSKNFFFKYSLGSSGFWDLSQIKPKGNKKSLLCWTRSDFVLIGNYIQKWLSPKFSQRILPFFSIFKKVPEKRNVLDQICHYRLAEKRHSKCTTIDMLTMSPQNKRKRLYFVGQNTLINNHFSSTNSSCNSRTTRTTTRM